MLKIAITGNIASGKSQVEKILAENYAVYDADKIAHKFLGNVDRKKLGAVVFSNPEERRKLEARIHPLVKDEILRIFSEENSDVIFVSVPLLFEARFESIFDKILFVASDENTRLKRLMKRNNLTEEEAVLRMHSQAPQEDKISKSDYVIYNNSSLEELEKQVQSFINTCLKA